jgi:hypothetical protein
MPDASAGKPHPERFAPEANMVKIEFRGGAGLDLDEGLVQNIAQG